MNLNDFQTWLASRATAIQSVLPQDRNIGGFLTSLVVSAHRDARVLECEQQSLFGSIMQAAQVGLDPGEARGLCFLVPFLDVESGRTYCTFMMGYKGIVELLHRSSRVASTYAHVVHQGDTFDVELGLDRKIKHKPILRVVTTEGGNLITHAYGVIKYNVAGSDPDFQVIDQPYVEKVKRTSPTAHLPSSPWQKWPEAMWQKTALKVSSRFAQLGVDDPNISGALRSDERIVFGWDEATSQPLTSAEEKVATPDVGGAASQGSAVDNFLASRGVMNPPAEGVAVATIQATPEVPVAPQATEAPVDVAQPEATAAVKLPNNGNNECGVCGKPFGECKHTAWTKDMPPAAHHTLPMFEAPEHRPAFGEHVTPRAPVVAAPAQESAAPPPEVVSPAPAATETPESKPEAPPAKPASKRATPTRRRPAASAPDLPPEPPADPVT